MNTIGLRQQLVLFAWASAGAYVLFPTGWLGVLPPPLQIGDVLAAVTGAVLLILLSRGLRLPKPSHPSVVLLGACYVSAVVIIPLFGLIFLGAPLEWYWGDLRWVTISVLFFGLLAGYARTSTPQTFERDLVWVVWGMVLSQYPFVISQFGMQQFGWNPGPLLDLWYPEGEGGHGSYGVHIHRYSGAVGGPASLSLIGGIGFVLGGLQLWMTGRRSAVALAGLAGLLTIAAGTRTMIFGAPMFLLGLWVHFNIQGRGVSRALYRRSVLAVCAMVPLVATAYGFNIGRVASSERLQSVLSWVSGRQSFTEVSGRGGQRWEAPVEEAFSDWSPLGTLVNSSHALDHYPAFDSYYVVAVAQAGPFIVVPFIALMLAICGYGVARMREGRIAGAVAVAVAGVLVLGTITQNGMTGLAGRIALLLAIVALACCWPAVGGQAPSAVWALPGRSRAARKSPRSQWSTTGW